MHECDAKGFVAHRMMIDALLGGGKAVGWSCKAMRQERKGRIHP